MRMIQPVGMSVLVGLLSFPAMGYVSFGNGFGSKWGDDAAFGTGAVVTWGFMPDGTGVDPAFRMDPFSFPNSTGLSGTSSISTLRHTIDNTLGHGSGAFDAAIQRAFDTWSREANIHFVFVSNDPGLPFASSGSTVPDIRIGAFVPEVGHSFNFVGAVGFGPRGGPWSTTDGLAGDILFNLGATFDIVAGTEDVTPIPAFTNDLEGLMLHELGHAAIGLGHPAWDGVSNPDQRVMYVGDFGNPNAPAGGVLINRELHADDIAGAVFTYGFPGDFDNSGALGAADLAQLTAEALAGTHNPYFDLTLDGMVNAQDAIYWITSDRVLDSSLGDLDLDGDVDDADFGLSFSNFTGPVGAGGGKSVATGDLDLDGDVDDADFGLSFAAFTGPGAGATVPEPASLMCVVVAGLFAARRRRDGLCVV